MQPSPQRPIFSRRKSEAGKICTNKGKNMKANTQLAIWGAVALSLAQTTTPLNAQSTTSSQTGSSMQSDKTLGNAERANKLIGMTVLSSDNQRLGKIDNFVVDLETGRILYAILGSGGILGAGEHRFAVAPGAFTQASGNNLQLNIDKAKLNGAPQFTKDMDTPENIAKADFISQVYQYFGQSAWWQGATAASAGLFHNVHKVSDLNGMKIENVSNQSMGKVHNTVLDLPAGRVLFVILAPDSSLELGNNYYALPPNALTWNTEQKGLVSDISKEKLASAPHFARDNWPSLSDPTFASQVYQYYGKSAYFGTSGLQPTGTPTGQPLLNDLNKEQNK
jgi:sporulation protein YlmC with PRC-barrel domain